MTLHLQDVQVKKVYLLGERVCERVRKCVIEKESIKERECVYRERVCYRKRERECNREREYKERERVIEKECVTGREGQRECNRERVSEKENERLGWRDLQSTSISCIFMCARLFLP